MSQARLELIRPYPAWHASAWIARLGDETVLASRGPEGADSARLARAEQRLALIESTHPDMWLPKAVVLSGGRLVWVYEHAEVVALAHLIHEGPSRLPLSAGLEVLAHVAEIFVAAGPIGISHAGPTPNNVLVDPMGRIRVAGFVEAAATPPSLQDPLGAGGEASLLYRLGALLSWLVTGVEPDRAPDESAHDASVRRALIRVMSRPGPVVTERFANWFRALRAWPMAERPPLSRVPDAMRRVADELGPSLQGWATRYVSPGRILGSESVDEVDDPTTFVTLPSTDESENTDPSIPPTGTLAHLDEPTQEQLSATPEFTPIRAEADRGAVPPVGAFGMPVRVGPPPTVVKQRPTLPTGFLDTVDPADEPSDGVAAPGDLPPAGPGLPAMLILAAITLGLMAAGALFLAYLLGPGEEPAPRPARIGEVLTTDEESTRVLIVHNPSGASLLVVCGEAETRTTGDAILPAEVPDCRVSADLAGTVVSLKLEVAGIVEVDCFDGEPACTIR